MRKPKRNAPKPPTSIAVVVDGDDEVWYLQMLKRNGPKIRISIKPEIPNKKSVEENTI